MRRIFKVLAVIVVLLGLGFFLFAGWQPMWGGFRKLFKEYGSPFLAELLVAAAGVFAYTVGERIARNWRRSVARFRGWISGRQLILLWIDTDMTTARRVGNRLKARFPFVRIRVLSDPKEILFYPMKPSVVEAIILINTDVSKLSADDEIREQIERKLEQYLLNGGGVVGGHDIIYRRARNQWLAAKAFGGEIDGFRLSSDVAVQYEKSVAGANHPIARRLPNRFELEDGEVVFVNWSEGAEILFQETRAREEDPIRALVVARSYENGRLVWLNSGDHGKKLANSIAKPSEALVDLLTASVEWVARLKLLARGAPLIAGHRGAPEIGGENTMVAFRAAIGLEADYIETDVRRTKDGVLVLHHDPTIGDVTIAEESFAELQAAAAAVKRPLARLEDLLKLAKGRIGLDLELKETGYEDEVAAMIQQYEFEVDRFVVTSFHEVAISRFKGFYPLAVCGLLIGEKRNKFSLRAWWRDWFPEKRLRAIGADFVAPNDRLVRFGFARRLASAKFPLWVWTVDNPLRIGELLHTPGVEAVITNKVYVGKHEQTRIREA